MRMRGPCGWSWSCNSLESTLYFSKKTAPAYFCQISAWSFRSCSTATSSRKTRAAPAWGAVLCGLCSSPVGVICHTAALRTRARSGAHTSDHCDAISTARPRSKVLSLREPLQATRRRRSVGPLRSELQNSAPRSRSRLLRWVSWPNAMSLPSIDSHGDGATLQKTNRRARPRALRPPSP